ncbi:MAG: hypothetical protein ACAI43_19020 [Phycisphaerae bacterium]
MNLSRVLGLGLAVVAVATPVSRTTAEEPKKAEAPARPAGGRAGGLGAAAIGDRIKAIAYQLDLSDEQKKKVDEIAAEAQKKAAEIPPGADGRADMLALRESTLAKVKAVLTAEQVKKLDALMAGGGAAGGPAGMLGALQGALKDLNLSDEQKTKMTASFETAQKKFEALRGELTGGRATPEAREKMKAIFDELRGDMEKTLTPEQSEKLREAMQRRIAPAPATGKKDL